MKRFVFKLSAGLCVGFLAFNVGMFSVFFTPGPSSIQFWTTDMSEEGEGRPVELCDLVNEAARFDGVLVRVKARVKVLSHGWTRVFNENCSATVRTESASGGDTVRRRLPESESRREVIVTGRVFAPADGQGAAAWSGFYVIEIEQEGPAGVRE
jgi:hypothetical protein